MIGALEKFRPIALIIAGLILSGGLLFAAIAHLRAVEGGTELILPAAAYDPRGLLTGHYSQVTYDISIAPAPLAAAAGLDSRWSWVWVTLSRTGEDYGVTGIAREKPTGAGAPGTFLVRAEAQQYAPELDGNIRYGIERIYAQQKEAEALDELLREPREDGADPPLKVVAALGTDGRLRLKGMILGGKRRDFTWW